MTVPTQLQIAGWREWLGLPDLGIDKIKAKLDTGARTSALHAVYIKPFERDGVEWVRFVVHPRQRSIKSSVEVESPILDWRRITSSNGERQDRPTITTDVHWFGLSWPIELTLTNRNNMGFRMLLGREALRQRITIDPGRSYLNGKPKRPKRSKKKRRKSARMPTSKKQLY